MLFSHLQSDGGNNNDDDDDDGDDDDDASIKLMTKIEEVHTSKVLGA